MYTVSVIQQGKPIRTEQVTAPDALAAISQVEKDYPAQTVVLNGQRFEWRGVDFQARKTTGN